MALATPIPRYHLYGENDPVEDFDFFHIETIRTRSKPHGWSLGAHSHAHLFQMLMITQGAGHLVDDTGEREISPKMAVFNPAGAVHGWTFTPDTQGYVVSFSHDYLGGREENRAEAERSALHAASNLVFELEREDLRRLTFCLEEMAEEFGNGRRRRDMFRPLLSLALVLIFSKKADAGELDRTPGFSLFRFRALVDEHFRTQRSPDFYATEMGLTTQRLNRYCRLFAERTAAQSIRDRVILEARRLIAFSDLSISQVAYDLGYEDPAYFSRVFRKETGEAPADFRARHAV
ncbi:helix-turn-helix domain-containing protein [Roseibium polysiphoniae]|uniref:Helix-turn-helix domain-containing protein n=1 Tax=Roseibium polysiphoniae TaxID=2571221 RepID=A0A944CAX9_9HYPH|nr:helix-turn-helix domain-containing protein [Roseibium polysiphoniae]MBS8259182.1 helix-turn-helix domain-containing protein [Roseibium polysiphoniae]